MYKYLVLVIDLTCVGVDWARELDKDLLSCFEGFDRLLQRAVALNFDLFNHVCLCYSSSTPNEEGHDEPLMKNDWF